MDGDEIIRAGTGSRFALHTFEAAVERDASITGAIYSGSLGRGTADPFSDLDIEIWVEDSVLRDVSILLGKFMSYLGHVQFLYERGESFATGFVGRGWQRVDLEIHPHAEKEPSAGYRDARIIKDSDGALAQLVAGSPEAPDAPTWQGVRGAIEEAIDSQIYLALHNARGAVWSAMGEVTYRASELYTLLALLRGRRSFGFRYVEELLSPGEVEMLRAAWPSEAGRDEVRRAARALCAWTRHVWKESEAALGRSLRIQIDEGALLAAIDRLYAEDR